MNTKKPENHGYNKAEAFAHVAQIGKTMDEILRRSRDDKMPSWLVADRIAEERIERKRRENR